MRGFIMQDTGMTVDTTEKKSAVQVESSTRKKKGRSKWEDPAIPVGNAPPLPKWPLAITTIAWVVWIVFLFMMMMSRTSSSAA